MSKRTDTLFKIALTTIALGLATTLPAILIYGFAQRLPGTWVYIGLGVTFVGMIGVGMVAVTEMWRDR